MPEIVGRGDNWFISYHLERGIDVLEVALPSNRRVRLEYIEGGEDICLKVLNRFEDKAEKWEAIACFKSGDLDGIAGLFSRVDHMLEGGSGRDWRLWRWFWRLVTGRRGDRDEIAETNEPGGKP